MMKIRKWIGILLALAAVTLAPCALADDEGVVVQSSCSIVQSGDYYLVYCYAQVHNQSDQIICLERGTFELRNGDQLVADEEITQMWPYFVEPGEDGYLFDVVAFEPNEDGVVVPAINGLEYFVQYMTVDAQYAGEKLQCAPRIEHEPDGSLYVICELQNATQIPAYDPSVAFGLYTDSGAMIYANGMTLQNVGIPAGGTTLVRFRVDDVFVSQWNSYGVSVAQVQAKAIFRNDAD